MDRLSTAPVARRSSGMITARWLAPGIMVLVLLGGFFVWHSWYGTPTPHATSPLPVNPAIEERWGVRVSHIGLSADGGLLDFRYVVIDPDKALEMVQNPKNLPELHVENNRAVLNSTALMAAKHDMAPGRTYFILYFNTDGAAKKGSSVSVVFGDLTLAHVIVQ